MNDAKIQTLAEFVDANQDFVTFGKIQRMVETVKDKSKLKVMIQRITRDTLARDCERQFKQDNAAVLRCSNRALRATERGEMPDAEDAQKMMFLAERAKFFEVMSDKLGVDIEV